MFNLKIWLERGKLEDYGKHSTMKYKSDASTAGTNLINDHA
jgi:hypothetical protein